MPRRFNSLIVSQGESYSQVGALVIHMEVSSRVHSAKLKKDEASSRDAELWKELLLKAQQGTTTEPYFIKRVGQSSLHTNVFCKIVLPALFLDHHHKSLKEKIILEDSFEHKWLAILGLTWQSKPCILQGWKQFAEDHDLQIGDQVVFFLVAKSHFMVQVFDADNNAKRRTPVTDRGYNNLDISVLKGRTNKYFKSIDNEEETSARTKSNLNLESKGLDETGATNDKLDAKHIFASVKVKIEGEAPDRSRLNPAETNLGPFSLGNIYTRCLTADGHEFFNILDTSEEEECEKVTSKSERRRTIHREKSPQISSKRRCFEVQTTKSEKSEERHVNVKIQNVGSAEDVALDGSLRYPPSKFHHSKRPKVPSEIVETHPILGHDSFMDGMLRKDTQKRTPSPEKNPSQNPVLENDSIMNRLLGKDTQKRTPSPEKNPSQNPVLENDSIMNRLLGKDTQKRTPSPEKNPSQNPVLENDSIMNRLLGKDTEKRSPSPEKNPSQNPVLENDSIMNRLLGKDTQKRSPSPENSPFEHPVSETDSIMNRLLGKDIQKRSPSPEATVSEHPVLENDSIMNMLGKDTQKRSPSREKKFCEYPGLVNDSVMNRLVGKDTQKRSLLLVEKPTEHPFLEIGSIMNTLLGREPQKRRTSPDRTPILGHPVSETDGIINRFVGKGGIAQVPDDIALVSSKMAKIHQQQKMSQMEKTIAELPILGKIESPRSPPPFEDTPSSPEQAVTLKRSRKLQRKVGGYYQGSENFKADDCMARLARLERLLKLSQDRQSEMRGSTTSNSRSTQCKTGECKSNKKSTETMKDHLRRSASIDVSGGGESFLFSHCEQDVLRKKEKTLQKMEQLFRKKIKETKVESKDGKVTHLKHLSRYDAQPVSGKVKERHQVVVDEDVVTNSTLREDATTTREVLVDNGSGGNTLMAQDDCVSRKKVILPEVRKELAVQQLLVGRDDENTSTTVKSKLLEPRDLKDTSGAALSQKPGGLECRLPVKSRHKVMMGSKDNKSSSSPITDPITPNRIPSPLLQAKPVYKRPPRKIRVPKNHPLLYKSKRRPVTTKEREDALALANAYAEKVTNQKFVMQLKTDQVYCGFHLKVPQEFVDALQMPARTMNMTLCDFTGKTWEVEWLSDEPGRCGFRSEGWTRFVLEHFLEEGDVCVFDLPDPQHFRISVHIFPVVELVEIPPNGWQGHYSLAADVPNTNEISTQPL